MKRLSEKIVLPNERMVHQEWCKRCEDRLPQKEKNRIFNDIISKINKFERKIFIP
jgi:hypothetical protein